MMQVLTNAQLQQNHLSQFFDFEASFANDTACLALMYEKTNMVVRRSLQVTSHNDGAM